MPSRKFQFDHYIHSSYWQFVSLNLIRFLIALILVSLPLQIVLADNLEWYPDQTSFAPTNASQSSWFDTLNWFNLAGAGPNGPIDGTPSFGPVPSYTDLVQLIGEDIVAQPPEQQAYSARHIVFGDFEKQAANPENNVIYSGGSATVDSLYISGDWTLDFGTNVTDGATGGLQITQDGGLQIGYSERSQGTANVQVIGPGTFASNQAGVGNDTGMNATITLDGTGGGTNWQNAGTLAAGASGTGNVVVQNGAALVSGDVNLGWFTGGVGNLSVSGIDPVTNTPSSFSGNLEIGQLGGSGSFGVTGGATATLGKASLAVGTGSSAEFTVSGANSKVSVAQSFALGNAGTITVSDGAQLLLDATATFSLAGPVGSSVEMNISDPTTLARFSPKSSRGTTTIEVTKGAAVQSDNAVDLSTNALATTNLTIDGKATTWTAANDFRMGSFGAVTTVVSGGAQVEVTGATRLAVANTASAQFTVTGANTKWSTGSILFGQSGNVTALIEKGATVDVAGEAQFTNTAGFASLTVTGTGSNLTAGGGIVLANHGSASLKVNDGGTVSGAYLQIAGDVANPDPTLSISGVGSKVTIANFMQFNNTIPISLKIEKGAVLDVGYATFGGYLSQTTATVTGAGSKWTSGTLAMMADPLSTIYVSNGALLQTERLLIESYIGNGLSTIQISNPGSRLDVTGYAQIGYHGNANISVFDGGSVTVAGETFLAQSDEDIVHVTVQGPGERWTNGGTLSVGGRGNGTFAISDGAIVKSSQAGSQHGHSAFIGEDLQGAGLVTVSGAGSLWQQDGILAVGYSGKGTLEVTSGGAVKSDSGFIAQRDGSTGTATINGAGSSWIVAHDLTLAGGKSPGNVGGQLFVQAGGSVSSENGFVAPDDSDLATVTVTGGNSVWTLSDSLYVGASNQPGIGGPGTVNANSAGLVEVAHNLMVGYYGSVDVTGGGAVTVGNATAINGAVHLGDGGLLAGYGHVLGTVINDAGTVSPGFSTGAFNIIGSFTQGAAGTLALELLGPPFSPPQSDILHVSGDVLLGGTISIRHIGNFLPQVGQTFDLITVGGNFAIDDLNIQFEDFPTATRYTTAFVDGTYQLTFTAVPEPGTGTLALLGCAAWLLRAATRRQNRARRAA